MSRNLDASLQAALAENLVQPVILAALTFRSGVAYVWSGVGDLAYGGNTYKGVGTLGQISPVSEGVSIAADGMTVRLSGIESIALAGASQAPPQLAAPVALGAGQYVAWSKPTAVATQQDPGSEGVASGTLTGGLITRNHFSADGTLSVTWSGFSAPDLPPDAVIVALYPTIYASCAGAIGILSSNFGIPSSSPFTGQYNAGSLGNTLAALEAASLGVADGGSLQNPYDGILELTSPAIAVYYTSASNAFNAVNEALSDIQLGATAQVYFGLMQNGALIGSPYLIFSGRVDQPTVDVDTETITISLALENKLSNLARPSARRYTANDQHMDYADDTGFNWVETLNDIALRWGS